jgi:hypothetical protein
MRPAKTAPGVPFVSSHCAEAPTHASAVTVALPSVVSSSHPPRVHANKLAHKTCAKLIKIKSRPSSIAIQHSRPAFVDGVPQCWPLKEIWITASRDLILINAAGDSY